VIHAGRECLNREDIMTGPLVLIIGSDAPFGRVLARELGRKALQVELKQSDANLPERLRQSKTDLLILDLNVSPACGLELLKKIRAEFGGLPILVLGSASRAEDMEQAFDHGADDFLRKPLSLRELTARCRCLLRRAGAGADNPRKSCRVTISRQRLSVLREGRQIGLTPKEFALLDFLACNAGKVVSRKTLHQELWNTSADSNVVDVYVKYLRDKIDKGHDRQVIRTVRGFGYTLSDDDVQYD